MNNAHKKNFFREIILAAVVIGSFIVMMSLAPISQTQAYHNFADQRTIFDVPNFWNVITNLVFALFGILGFLFCLKYRQKEAPWSWIVFFLGVTIVFIGSGYYHWNPNNDSLVWDRLPMTIGFMGLFIAILSEYANPNFERFILIPATLLGLFSVVIWHYFDDLRFYYWIQLVPLLTIPVVLIVFKGKYTLQSYLIIALIFYLLAKFSETYDVEIYSFSSENFSGHSLKHILAALGAFTIYLMLKRREVK